MKRSVQFENVIDFGKLLLNEMNNGNMYTRRINKEIADAAFDIVYTISDLIHAYVYKNSNIDIDNIMNSLISHGLMYTEYNMKPIDSIELFTQFSNKSYGFGKFIEKYSDSKVKGTIPIYIRFKFHQDNKPNDIEKGGYILRSKNRSKDFMYTFINESKIIIELYKPCVNNIVNIINDDFDEAVRDTITIMSHEMQHAFDDYIVYKKSVLQSKDKNLMYHNIDEFDIENDDRTLISTLLYFISDKEVSARINSIASLATYCLRNENLKNEFIDIRNNINKLRDYFHREQLKLGVVLHPHMRNLFDELNILSNSNIFNRVTEFNYIETMILNFHVMMKNDKKHFIRLMLIIGYYLMKNKKINYSITTAVDNNHIINVLNKEIINDVLSDKLPYSDYYEVAEFIGDNVLYWLYDYVIKVYKIFANHICEMFNITYPPRILNNNILNEDRRFKVYRELFEYMM